MYITAQTIISAVALTSAVTAIVGGLFSIYRWYQRQNKQDEYIKAMKEEIDGYWRYGFYCIGGCSGN